MQFEVNQRCPWQRGRPVEAGVAAASMMVVLKWVWLKEAVTLLLMRSISLKVSSLPWATWHAQGTKMATTHFTLLLVHSISLKEVL